MGIGNAIKNHKRIMLDTAPIVYFIEEHKTFGKISNELTKWIKGLNAFPFAM
ncbi:MAG: hypothetical protein HZA48_10095 [Planctomycetes bacterium]|nr:hypothetical protein [Planctomycetota bacterium]